MILGTFLLFFAAFADAAVIPPRETCTSQNCQNFAEAIKTSLNVRVDPCDDFYEFACGNWTQKNPRPEDDFVWNTMAMAREENRRRMAELLKAPPREGEIPSVKIAKAWYQSCVDTETIDREGMRSLASIVGKIGGWPILMGYEAWNETKYKWQVVDDYYADLMGTNWFHELRVAAYGSSEALGVVVDVPDVPPGTWLLNEEVNDVHVNRADTYEIEADIGPERYKKDGYYWKFMLKIVLEMANVTGSTMPTAFLEKEMEDILNFQWRFDKITYLMDNYQNTTLGEMQSWYNRMNTGAVDWEAKIKKIFKNANVDISSNTPVTVVSPKYFESLATLLETTPMRTLVNYMHWNFISTMVDRYTEEISSMIDNAHSASTASYTETDKEIARSKKCLYEARMYDIITYEYVRLFYTNRTFDLAMQTLEDIRYHVEEQIIQSDWADTDTKVYAIRKIRNIKKHIGYPEWYKNMTLMNHYFDGLNIAPSFYENSLNLRKFYRLKNLKELVYKDPAKPWIIHPLVVNAFYMTDENSITIPVSVLQYPFFSPDQPNTVNYAITGSILGHELYHSLDHDRHCYNRHGKYEQWSIRMEEQYEQRSRCFVEQYNEYTLDGKPNGEKIPNFGQQTINENIADTMGFEAAFRAYKVRENINNRPEQAIPELQTFTNDQMFFLSYANVYCETYNPDLMLPFLRGSVHSPGRMRVTGTLSNSKEFSKAFSCPIGSNMNPVTKCNIWRKSIVP